MFSTRLRVDSQNNICLDHNGPRLDFYARKLDPRGNQIWEASFGDPTRNESSNWLAVDSRGDVIVTGERAVTGMVTVKFGANGGVLWASEQPGSVTEGYRVEVDAADNIYVAGVRFDPSNRRDFVVVKFDGRGHRRRHRARRLGLRVWRRWPDSGCTLDRFGPTGAPAWTVVHRGPHGPFGYARRLAIDSAGNIVAVGHGNSTTAYMDWLIFKVDPAGHVLWTRTHDGFPGNDEFATAVGIGADDAVYVSGAAGANCLGFRGLGLATIRYDAAGNVVWTHEAECAGGNPTAVVIDSFGDLLINGGSASPTVLRLEESTWTTLGASLTGTRGEPDLDAQGYLDPRGMITASLGRASLAFALPTVIPSATEIYLQSWIVDPAAAQGLAASDAVVKALQ